MQKEITYTKWIVQCTIHGHRCNAVKSTGLTFKQGPTPTLFRGQQAFFFRYSGGMKIGRLTNHYPKDKYGHRFEITPLPGRIHVIMKEGMCIIDEEKLYEGKQESVVKDNGEKKEEEVKWTSNDAGNDENETRESVKKEESPNDEMDAVKEEFIIEVEEEYEPKNFKKVKIEESKASDIFEHETGANVNLIPEGQIVIIVRDKKAKSKLKKRARRCQSWKMYKYVK